MASLPALATASLVAYPRMLYSGQTHRYPWEKPRLPRICRTIDSMAILKSGEARLGSQRGSAMRADDDLLQELLEQEEELQFTSFTNETALELGMALLNAARTRSQPVTIDITRHGQQLFHYAMSGTSANNDHWIRRKNNVVAR